LNAISRAGEDDNDDDDGDSGDDSGEHNSEGSGDEDDEDEDDEDEDDEDDDEDDDGEDAGMNNLGHLVASLGLADEGTTPELQNIGTYSGMARGILKGSSVEKKTAKLYPEYKTRRHATKFFARGKVSSTIQCHFDGC
jgi:hypothetical protein